MAVMPWPIFCGGIMPCGGIGGSWLLPGGLLTPINAKVMALRWSFPGAPGMLILRPL
jgi:hypothetical protein